MSQPSLEYFLFIPSQIAIFHEDFNKKSQFLSNRMVEIYAFICNNNAYYLLMRRDNADDIKY